MSDEPRENIYRYAYTPSTVAEILAKRLMDTARIFSAIPSVYVEEAKQRAMMQFVLSEIGSHIEDASVRLVELSPNEPPSDNGKTGDQ